MKYMEQIYKEYARTVYKFLLSRCHSEDLAEELTQETFYQAVRSIDRFDGSCKISVWLCQIAKHLWYRYLEKHKREIPVENLQETEAASAAEEEVMDRERQLDLLKQIHHLSPAAREAVYLRIFGNLSFREIGEVLGKTENWARVTFYRSKEKLKGGIGHES